MCGCECGREPGDGGCVGARDGSSAGEAPPWFCVLLLLEKMETNVKTSRAVWPPGYEEMAFQQPPKRIAREGKKVHMTKFIFHMYHANSPVLLPGEAQNNNIIKQRCKHNGLAACLMTND